MIICRDTIVNSVSLLVRFSNSSVNSYNFVKPLNVLQINSTTRVQWKLLLEQNSIGYIFPDDSQRSVDISIQHTTPEEDWQIVIPISKSERSSLAEPNISSSSEFEGNNERPGDEPGNKEDTVAVRSVSPPLASVSGIFPAARARLASLRDLGAKKIGALKLKLIENKLKSNERGE